MATRGKEKQNVAESKFEINIFSTISLILVILLVVLKLT